MEQMLLNKTNTKSKELYSSKLRLGQNTIVMTLEAKLHIINEKD